MSISHISPHFTWAEAACHDGSEVPLELQPNARILANLVLEPIRERFGHSVIPLSWYRSPEWNERVGGAEGSFHMQALAADIRPSSLPDLPQLRAVIEDMILAGHLPALGGIGVYKAWLHVDARPRNGKPVARWYGGNAIGQEQS